MNVPHESLQKSETESKDGNRTKDTSQLNLRVISLWLAERDAVEKIDAVEKDLEQSE